MLRRILLGILLNGLALYLVTLLLPEIQYTGGLRFFVIGGIAIGFMNTFIKPIMKILSFPIVFLTLGLFSFVINVLIFWLTVKLINAISLGGVSVIIPSVLTYVLGALMFTIVNWVLHVIIRNK